MECGLWWFVASIVAALRVLVLLIIYVVLRGVLFAGCGGLFWIC